LLTDSISGVTRVLDDADAALQAYRRSMLARAEPANEDLFFDDFEFAFERVR